MKRLLLLVFLAFSAFAVNAQEISEEQWSLISKKTATWCTNCGSWGWTFKNYLLEDYADDNVVVWSLHYSGDLLNPTAKAITDNFGGGGQPIFYLNTDNMGVGSFNLDAKRGEFMTVVESLNSFEPFAGVGTTATFDGQKITTTSKAKFLIDLEGGNYWLAAYLVDDELVANQASQGQNALHKNILLNTFTGDNHFGENIATGAVSVNDEFTMEGELDFTGQNDIPDYSDGYSVVTILWGFVGGQYTPINLNKQPITSVVSTKDVLSNVDITAYQGGAGQVNLNITSAQEINDASISLLDINGRIVANQRDVQIITGKNQFILNTQELAIGTYIVFVESSIGTKSIKVSIQ